MTSFIPSGKTKVFGIFGTPIRHTLSPQMHHAAFEAMALPNVYLPFEVQPEDLEQAVKAIIPLGIQGINVTIPHKTAVIPYLDEIDPEAEKIGAVNTIKNDAGRLIGFNTDGKGFVRSLHESGVEPAGMTVLLIGAGGAARGVAIALLSAGVREIILSVRRAEAGESLARDLKSVSPASKVSVVGFPPLQNKITTSKSPILLINSTPLGMNVGDPLPFPPTQINADWVVADLIYHPYETALLLAAKEVGAKTVPGLGMLLHQGALAFEIWTKQKPPIEVMRKTLLKAFHSLSN